MVRVEERKELVQKYFDHGYSYKEILACLIGIHGINLSLRQLKRDLKSLGLMRRKNQYSQTLIRDAIMAELTGSGCNLGYRSMHNKLMLIYNITVSRENVRKIMKELDPEGVQERSKHRLKRRQYVSKGPNYTWHLDGYDKLKPYGFCIHGCIDGYSRKILWLQVSSSNNDPAMISSYYIECVKSLQGTARRIRGDYGTENLNVAAIQRFFRAKYSDPFAGEKSFMFGKSTSNQRIEAWWSRLRQYTAQFWMNFFKDMVDDGTLNYCDPMSRDCIRFCFTDIIQKDLDQTRLLHNNHRIRPYSKQECPNGRPELIYSLPGAYGTHDFLCKVTDEDVELAKLTASAGKPLNGCTDEFFKLSTSIMGINGWSFPISAEEAKHLYSNLMYEISIL